LPRYGFQQDGEGDGLYTGFFYGAAGLGLTLLDMHYANAKGRSFVAWPDDAFLPLRAFP
jgi:hypothetical protein